MFLFKLAEVLENLHAAAFRDTLGRSLYAPEYMVDRIGSEMLLDYVNKMYTAENMALVGMGKIRLNFRIECLHSYICNTVKS